MKAELREQPDLYFFELRAKFVQRWRWAISDRMISQALKVDGGVEGDEPLDKTALAASVRRATPPTAPSTGAPPSSPNADFFANTYY